METNHMTDANTPEGTGIDTAYSVDEAAGQLETMWDDDPETDTGDHDGEADAADDDPEADADDAADDGDDEAEPADDEEEAEPAALTDDTEIDLGDGQKVALAELRKGYLRQADYTRKTQETAEIRRRVSEKDSQLDGAVRDLIGKYEVLEKIHASAIPPFPTADMAATDPFGYTEQLARHNEALTKYQGIRQQLEEARQMEAHRKQSVEAEERRAQYEALIAWKPELQDPQKRSNFGNELMAAAARYGFTKEDFGNLWDVRIIKLMDDARRYQDLKAKAPKAVEKARKAPPVIQPKQRQSPGATQKRSVQQAQERLRKTGSIDDAARILMSLD